MDRRKLERDSTGMLNWVRASAMADEKTVGEKKSGWPDFTACRIQASAASKLLQVMLMLRWTREFPVPTTGHLAVAMYRYMCRIGKKHRQCGVAHWGHSLLNDVIYPQKRGFATSATITSNDRMHVIFRFNSRHEPRIFAPREARCHYFG